MNKRVLIEQIIQQLEHDLDIAKQAAQRAHDSATHEESIAENKYDTLGLEASYLAEGQSRRVEALQQDILLYRRLLERLDDQISESVSVGCLVFLQDDSDEKIHRYFLGPSAGGLVIESNHEDKSITVITTDSPLGKAMQGKSVDDDVVLPEVTVIQAKQRLFYIDRII